MALESTTSHQMRTAAAPREGLAPRAGTDPLEALGALERRFAQLRSAPPDDPLAAAGELADLELSLGELAQSAATMDSLASATREALRADLQDWLQLAEQLSLGQAAAAAQHLIDQTIAAETQAWHEIALEVLQRASPEELFASLRQASRLRFETWAAAGTGDLSATLDAIRGELREALAGACDENPPAQELRRHWAADLIDRAETALTAIDDMPLVRGSAWLSIVSDDLAWHLERIETARGPWRFRLRRKLRRVRAEHQERQLQNRLETIFGRPAVAFFERLILLLICFVLGLLVVEHALALSQQTVFWLNLADAAACGVFLLEFFVKLALVRGRASWFARHVLIDLVPSLPFGLLFAAHAGDNLRAARALRFLRLSRFARYIRIFRPLVRLLRGFGFLIRGIDRLVRRYGRLLNRDVILYPTRAERAVSLPAARSIAPRLRRAQAEIQREWKRLVGSTAPSLRAAVAELRLGPLRQACAQAPGAAPGDREPAPATAREITAEMLLREQAVATGRDIEDALGSELTARLARWVRLFSRPPLCWFPIIRAYVPRLARDMNDAQTVAAAARRLSSVLKRHHDRWFWLADLYGTVTPSQFVDRIGTMLVRASLRPAYRLAIFGGLFLITQQALRLTPSLQPVYEFCNRFVNATILTLGGICFVLLGIGWWLRRLAREATEFYERAVHAQFLPLTEVVRSRHLDRAARVLSQRVLLPEWHIRAPSQPPPDTVAVFKEQIARALVGTHLDSQHGALETFERTVLLYRDALDGALLADSDTRTTAQLLGNPAIQQVLELSHRLHKKARSLQALDLQRQKSLLGGPYLWFNCIARATAHSVACLLVEYNRQAIPLAELPLAQPAERQRYEQWLRRSPSDAAMPLEAEHAARYVTTAFTALHFLDFDSQRDADVAERFGPAVLERLRRDRSLLIRRVFGTYPLHQLPKDQRVLNLHKLYEQFLSGGRAVLLPLLITWRMIKLGGRLVRWIGRAIREIRDPKQRLDRSNAAQADFATAVRKIDRTRGPVVQATMRVRAAVDPEYHGIPLPGMAPLALAPPQVDADVRFLQDDPALAEDLLLERRRAEADLRRLHKLMEGGLLTSLARNLGLADSALSTPEHIRAAAVAYVGDYQGVRELLSAREILAETYQMAVLEHVPPPFPKPHLALRRMFRLYWSIYGFGGNEERRAAWRATVLDANGVQAALQAWHQLGESAPAEGERILGELLRHPGRISEQLVSLRTIQSLALLDVLLYREHVFELGRYADEGDEPGEYIHWEAGLRPSRPA
jgi:hypothetical protein